MAITYYMLQMPPLLLFLLITIFSAVFTGLCTFFFRKFIKVRVLRSHNEVTGFFFLAIASLCSLLLSFVVFVVWGQLNETQSNVSKEGSSAMGLYRDIKFYPDTAQSKHLMAVYLNFVFDVVDDEFPKMKLMKISRRTPESFNKVYYFMEHLNPTNPFQIQLVAEMFNHLNELDRYRGLRTSSINAEIPAYMWLPIIIGALITIICGMLLDVEHTNVHVFLNAFFGGFIGMLLFLIILLDHPFSGSLGIKPASYMEIFTLEQWANEKHIK